MNKKFDVIVIGSGIGGLTAAGLLSKTKKVLVLEKNNTFGGYCSSFKRGRFTFDSAIQAINGIHKKSSIYRILTDSGALNKTNILSPKRLYKAIFPDHEVTVPQKNLSVYKNMLSSLFPREKNNISKLFDIMKSLFVEMERFHTFYSDRSFKKSPLILKYCRKSLKEFLGEIIRDDKLKAIISQYWMYRGLPPSKLSAVTFSYICYDYTANGSYYPQDGANCLIENTIKAIIRNGGTVLRNAEVSKLYANRDNRLTEIELKNGDRFKADSFISNMDVFKTFKMAKNLNSDDIAPFLHKLNRNILSISAFKIYLGLDIDVKELGVKEYEIFMNPGYDIELMYEASVKNDVEKMPCSITVYSNLTGKFCKKNNSVISIGLLSGYDYWKSLSRQEYQKRKMEMSESILSKCELILPNLKKHIVERIIATPLTMERYTGNSCGSAYGWNKKNLVEEINFMNPTTPLKNLFLASHWTKIGGGVAGVILSSDRVYSLLKDRY